MPCPTCSHTVESLGLTLDRRRFFWCPRCGTLVMQNTDDAGEVERVTSDAPKLVERCRKFRKVMTDGADACEWARMGIEESINLPENRPQ